MPSTEQMPLPPQERHTLFFQAVYYGKWHDALSIYQRTVDEELKAEYTSTSELLFRDICAHSESFKIFCHLELVAFTGRDILCAVETSNFLILKSVLSSYWSLDRLMAESDWRNFQNHISGPPPSTMQNDIIFLVSALFLSAARSSDFRIAKLLLEHMIKLDGSAMLLLESFDASFVVAIMSSNSTSSNIAEYLLRERVFNLADSLDLALESFRNHPHLVLALLDTYHGSILSGRLFMEANVSTSILYRFLSSNLPPTDEILMKEFLYSGEIKAAATLEICSNFRVALDLEDLDLTRLELPALKYLTTTRNFTLEMKAQVLERFLEANEFSDFQWFRFFSPLIEKSNKRALSFENLIESENIVTDYGKAQELLSKHQEASYAVSKLLLRRYALSDVPCKMPHGYSDSHLFCRYLFLYTDAEDHQQLFPYILQELVEIKSVDKMDALLEAAAQVLESTAEDQKLDVQLQIRMALNEALMNAVIAEDCDIVFLIVYNGGGVVLKSDEVQEEELLYPWILEAAQLRRSDILETLLLPFTCEHEGSSIVDLPLAEIEDSVRLCLPTAAPLEELSDQDLFLAISKAADTIWVLVNLSLSQESHLLDKMRRVLNSEWRVDRIEFVDDDEIQTLFNVM
ncbi:hypothetical protein HDU97_003531 [Phlyctochytrium planicorne]|nr:hypothetical protein HDU97_003531 [Phlyctochytrium planicorne]